jgi:tetratricopeptide (TPR) repeat protein
MIRNLVVSAALSWACLGYIATAALAQDPILAELYGSGVHEYFSGGYQQAIADLSQAVDGGSKDPRVYYFRALCFWRLGDTPKAQIDLATGAKMESADINQYYPVSKSLERVQGSGRLLLERYRVQARAEAYRRQEKRNLARYEAQRKAEAEVLRATPPPPEPGAIAPPSGKPAAAEPAADMPAEDKDPFADDSDTSTDEKAMPADDAAPAEEGADADASSPADEMPAEESTDEADAMEEEAAGDAPTK